MIIVRVWERIFAFPAAHGGDFWEPILRPTSVASRDGAPR
jgi:hypothetical protein